MGNQARAAIAATAALATLALACHVFIVIVWGRSAWKTTFGIAFAAANILAFAEEWVPDRHAGAIIVPGIIVAIVQYSWEFGVAVAALWYAGLAATRVAALDKTGLGFASK